MQYGAILAAGRKQVLVHGMPHHSDDVLVVPFQKEDIAHHPYVKDAGGMVTGACC